MPTYEYACTECGERLEVVQRFSDDPLTVCPACEGKLRKLFSPVGVVFKGSGFYKTDSRGGKQKTAAAAETSSDAGSANSDSKPAAATDSSDAPASTTADSAKAASPTSPAKSDSTGGDSKVA
jgi:putative FmdB family regulatory protein